MIPSVVWFQFPDLAVIAACAGVVAGMSILSIIASRFESARERRRKFITEQLHSRRARRTEVA